MVALIAILIVWAVFGVLTYAAALAELQNEYAMFRSKDDVIAAIMVGMTGPIGLLVVGVDTGFRYGLQFLPKPPMTREEYLEMVYKGGLEDA